MNTTPHRLAFRAVAFLALALIPHSAGAQSYSKTFTRSAAMNPGISVQLCQNDALVLKTPGRVKSVGITLNNVEPVFDGTTVILRGNATSGRAPVLVLMADSDDVYRLHITSCPSRGASTLITIVDDTPAPTGAKEYQAQPVAAPRVTTPITATVTAPTGSPELTPATANTLNAAAAIGTGGYITLPTTPTTVKLDVARSETGLTLTVTNGTAQTLSLRPEALQVFAGGQAQVIPAAVTGSVAPGLSVAFTIPLPADVKASDAQVAWLVSVPGLKANFMIRGSLD